MIPQFQAALELQSFLKERGWSFCIIGGLAVFRWGEFRTTQDVDVTLLTGFGDEEGFIRPLLERFASRKPDAEEFALRNRVLLLTASNDVGVDVSLGALPFEEQLVARASAFAFEPGVSLITCSAEDLVVLKAFAGRGQDWRDVEGVLVRQEPRLDWKYIREWLPQLCELKEAPEIVDQLEAMRVKLDKERRDAPKALRDLRRPKPRRGSNK